MKMMLAYQWADRKPDKLNEMINLCLSFQCLDNACNNLDVITILYECGKYTDYRRDEVIEYSHSMLDVYKKFWWPEQGGFSFYENKASKVYYGATVSRGKAEPDIHDSGLNLYSISMIAEICGYGDEFHFSVPKT